MDLKIRVILSLVVLAIVVRDGKGYKACDWPRGVCTYIYDPCPPTFTRCRRYDYSCPVRTNHCCCRTRIQGDEPKLEAPAARDIVYGDEPKLEAPAARDIVYGDEPKLEAPAARDIVYGDEPKLEAPAARDFVDVRGQAQVKCDARIRGTCWYRRDPSECPTGFKRCPLFDGGCASPDNWCCCLAA
ncbi:uncharacterized protein LOC141897205 isoform X2 [Acropora palmata]|uniref:uncharacterized protein LOC141897205 isoform X2 n=1 Tax=Acropora palmata TaxID=6131 RepID=UPI003D9FB4B4